MAYANLNKGLYQKIGAFHLWKMKKCIVILSLIH